MLGNPEQNRTDQFNQTLSVLNLWICGSFSNSKEKTDNNCTDVNFGQFPALLFEADI